jgi:single-strand DNA-binding protein
MNNLNSIIIEGNLVKAPELYTTSKGTSLCHLSVAVNRWYKSMNGDMQNEVSFFDVDTWGNLAETVAEKCGKGRGVRVVGRLKQERWIDANGKNCSKVVVVAEHIEFKPEVKQGTENEAAMEVESSVEDEPLAVNW